jgi:hypothetical protein
MKKLKWGQTPWDDMDKEELLLTIFKMYSAVVSLDSCLSTIRPNVPGHAYWGTKGVGGRALEKSRQVLDPIHESVEGGSGEIYRAFFRYAPDLIFEPGEYQLGWGWTVCPECGKMLGRSTNGESKEGELCSDLFPKDCSGIFRKLSWYDLGRPEFEK